MKLAPIWSEFVTKIENFLEKRLHLDNILAYTCFCIWKLSLEIFRASEMVSMNMRFYDVINVELFANTIFYNFCIVFIATSS
eukprot:scaffold908_cov47-Attheya_sp.AAC.5